jgi:NitT/TauT family transport system ATP-binding protein
MSLRCVRISKVYSSLRGEIVALKELDLKIEREEFVCIVGPSGCGKTTLLKIIAGLITPTGGKIVFDEPVVKDQPRNAMVFQDQGLFPWMTVLENVAFGLEMRGVSRSARQTKAREFLTRVGLGDFWSNYPHELSGGMRQRVAILRAFLTNPQMLLMDEPFGALDAQTRLLMQEELLKIWREDRKTVVYVTHDIDEAIHLGDRVLVMSGRPGFIRADIAIPLKRQFNVMDQQHPDLVRIRQSIWGMIKDDVRKDLRIVQ